MGLEFLKGGRAFPPPRQSLGNTELGTDHGNHTKRVVTARGGKCNRYQWEPSVLLAAVELLSTALFRPAVCDAASLRLTVE